MASFCCTYDVDYKYLDEDHELGAGENVTGKVDFVFVDPPYNVRKNRNENNMESDLHTYQEIIDMPMILTDVINPGAHGHDFCTSRQLAV